MPQKRDEVLVLWSDQFEEATTTIFVTELRTAGLRVKVVGLTPPPISGVNGLVLTPDLTLDQALSRTGHTICVIIPHRAHMPMRLGNDPRLRAFFERAGANQARFVTGWSSENGEMDGGLFSTGERVMVYPSNEKLFEFARELAGLLLKTNGRKETKLWQIKSKFGN